MHEPKTTQSTILSILANLMIDSPLSLLESQKCRDLHLKDITQSVLINLKELK